MKRKFLLDKLIRDKVLSLMQSQDIAVHRHDNLTQEQVLSYYKKKLHEEATEVVEAYSKEELLEELADCLEVIDGLCHFLNISKDELLKVKQSKVERNGGFEEKIIVNTIEVDNNSPSIERFLEKPKAYTEII